VNGPEIVQKVLDQVVAEGYTPREVSLPKRLGCRACGTVNSGKDPKDWTTFMLTVVGVKLDGGIYLFSYVLLCAETCLKSTGAHEGVIKEILENA